MKFNLADNTAFLIFRLTSKIAPDAAQAFKKAGVSTMQARILLALSGVESWTVGNLCRFTAIDQSTMSHSLVTLARRGLVSKRRLVSDNRTVCVRLTAKGQETARQCAEIASMFDRSFALALDASRTATLKRLLTAFYEGLVEQSIAAE
jgi:DNA-binding MarR family transcriptional regulator